MSINFFDYDDGNFMLQMSDNVALDMGTGNIHFTSGWSDEE